MYHWMMSLIDSCSKAQLVWRLFVSNGDVFITRNGSNCFENPSNNMQLISVMKIIAESWCLMQGMESSFNALNSD